MVIAGPTGAGKTALALHLAERLGAEIVSADSRQVYRRFDVGTAKPTVDERAQAPHHLIDVAEPTDVYTVARYQDEAERALSEIRARRGLALLVGGTGHYIQAVVERLAVPRVSPDWEYRRSLEILAADEGPLVLHQMLAELDPVAAARIPAANVRRVIRALEVIERTGQQFSAQNRDRAPERAALKLVLTMARSELYARVDRRVDEMLAQGWLDEVARLLKEGLDPASPAMSSSGYRELAAHLRGELSLAAAVQRAKYSVHGYVRRQYIWFRRQPGFEWIEVRPGYEEQVLERVQRYLAAEAERLEEQWSTS